MGVRRTINRYRTVPSGYDYADVLRRGKRFHTHLGEHSTFEMQPYQSGGRVLWSAESVTLPPFVAPRGTIRISWNGKRWVESPLSSIRHNS